MDVTRGADQRVTFGDERSRPYDVVVVGAGPAGLFAAHRTAALGGRVLLLEAGKGMFPSLCPRVRVAASGRSVRDLEKFRLQCRRCTCLTGVGGAAFHFDTNLGYVKGLTRSKIELSPDGKPQSYSGLERALGDFERASGLIASVYEQFYAWGMKRPHAAPAASLAGAGSTASASGTASAFHYSDTAPSQEITVDESLGVIAAIEEEFAQLGGQLLLETRVEAIRKVTDHFVVEAGAREFRARNVVVGAGKLGLEWVRVVVTNLGVEHTAPQHIDLGVRIESWREDLVPLTAACHNPKHSFINDRGEMVRTFCVCPSGRLMAYDFAGGVALDGQHCLTTPTTRTNFGVVTSVRVPENTDGTELGLALCRRVGAEGEGKPVIQRVADFLGTPPSGKPVPSTLHDGVAGDLRSILGPGLSSDVTAMVERLNQVSPGMVGGHAVVAAPVVERIYPNLTLNPDLESSVPGLFFVGDSSSKIIGVTYGAVTGMVAAEAAMRQ